MRSFFIQRPMRITEENMKNDKLKVTLGNVFALIGCVAAAILIWLIVKYNYNSSAEQALSVLRGLRGMR